MLLNKSRKWQRRVAVKNPENTQGCARMVFVVGTISVSNSCVCLGCHFLGHHVTEWIGSFLSKSPSKHLRVSENLRGLLLKGRRKTREWLYWVPGRIFTKYLCPSESPRLQDLSVADELQHCFEETLSFGEKQSRESLWSWEDTGTVFLGNTKQAGPPGLGVEKSH